MATDQKINDRTEDGHPDLKEGLKCIRYANYMNKFQFYTTLILFQILYFSCQKEDPEPEKVFSLKLDGIYELISLHSATAVDLDFDGESNTNIILETHEEDNIDRYFLEFNSVRYDWDPVFY
jgi:hypothetical protein